MRIVTGSSRKAGSFWDKDELVASDEGLSKTLNELKVMLELCTTMILQRVPQLLHEQNKELYTLPNMVPF